MTSNIPYTNKPIYISACESLNALPALESKFRHKNFIEIMPIARNNTPLMEIVLSVKPDKTDNAIFDNGLLKHKIYFCRTLHATTISATDLGRKTLLFLEEMSKNDYPMDILSISVGIDKDSLCDTFIFRAYSAETPDLSHFYDSIGTSVGAGQAERKAASYIYEAESESTDSYTENELREYDAAMEKQNRALAEASLDKPFLNALDKYTSVDFKKQNKAIPIYSLAERQKTALNTLVSYNEFRNIFSDAIRYLSGVEKDAYDNALRLRGRERDRAINEFMNKTAAYHVRRLYVTEQKRLPLEDVATMLKQIKRAMFDLYIIQDLIDDPDITDIKITDPESVRVRIHGKGYMSDIAFIDENDYIRFVNALAITNSIDLFIPSQTFTDTNNKDFILRFSITAPYVTANTYPVIHIRKISRKKLMGDDLIKAGMFDEKIRQYLIDCGRHSKGVVFAGPPGSGKTVIMNWFLEDGYEDSAEVLVIQENDELFSYKKGIIFEHVVANPTGDEKACSLEDLGVMSLVSGANVFVIGEAKGPEICSAITLSNSGCRTAITIHSPSASETIDKMADLAVRGYADNHEQAKKMLKSFQTIVYLRDFKVQEITEILGYDEEKKDMIYRPIYRRSMEQEIASN